ncbi:MAG: hypothetical protein JKY28_05020 [Sulfurimonas sp.]|nr:hypothetical protein [Sulfurimonas sp.]PHQ89136.1 MAG: hypothetical protein COB42_07490 [Sulfurimonas sp.]
MSIDNTLYESLEKLYSEIQKLMDTSQFANANTELIIRHEELADKLNNLDIEAIKNQSNDLDALNERFNEVKQESDKVIESLNDTLHIVDKIAKIVKKVDTIISKLSKIVV